MKSQAIIGILGLALAAAPILAQDVPANAPENSEPVAEAQQVGSSQVAAAVSPESDPGEQVICRRDRATGSLTRVNRVCKTRNEWNSTADRTRDNVNDLQRGASGGRECRQDTMGGC